MNEVTIKGEVVFVDEVREWGKNNFRKHEVVIKTGDEKFPNPIKIEFVKTAIDASTALQVGQQVEVACRLNGRGWENKQGETQYFVSCEGMEISYTQGEPVRDPVRDPVRNDVQDDDEDDDAPPF